MRTLLQRAALAASLALVLGATLRPVGGSNHVAFAPWAARQLNAVNVVGNIALFALPSAVLWSFPLVPTTNSRGGICPLARHRAAAARDSRTDERDGRRALQHPRGGRRLAVGCEARFDLRTR